MRILVVGVGNVLRGDDGFGVEVAEVLGGVDLPAGVEVHEVGIGGIHLVQELLTPADGLIVVDAVDRDCPPGTLVVLRPDVPDLHALEAGDRRTQLADMHYAEPGRALMLARGLGVLPEKVVVVGCQTGDPDRLGQGLSTPVAAAVPRAVEEVRRILREWTTTAGG